MEASTKLVQMRNRQAQSASPLTPELKDFIDRAIVPILVRQYLEEEENKKPLARKPDDAAHSAQCEVKR